MPRASKVPRRVVQPRLVLAVACAALLFATSAVSGQSGTISVLMGVDAAGKKMQQDAAEFEKQTGIRVELAVVSWDDLTTKQSVVLSSGSGTYDVVNTYRGWILQYAPAGFYEPLAKRMSAEELNAIPPNIRDFFSYKGQLYAYPLAVSVNIMFYNKQLFQEAGLDPNRPPQTFTELIQFGQKLTKGDRWGYVDSYSNYNAFVRFLYAHGGKLYQERNGRVDWTFNSPEGVAALTLMRELVTKHKIAPQSVLTMDQQEAAKLFSEGKAAMFVNWELMLQVLNDPKASKVVGKVGFAPMPGARSGLTGTSAGHEGLGIPSASRNKDAAWKFIRFMTTQDRIRRRAVEEGFTPPYTGLLRDKTLIAKAPYLPTVIKVLPYQAIQPPISKFQQFRDALMREVMAALTGKKDPKAALQAAEAEAKKLTE